MRRRISTSLGVRQALIGALGYEAGYDNDNESDDSEIGDWQYQEIGTRDGRLKEAKAADLVRLVRGIAKGIETEKIGGLAQV